MGLLNKAPRWRMDKRDGQSNREHGKVKMPVIFFPQAAMEAKAASEKGAQ